MWHINCSWIKTIKKEIMKHILKNIKTSFVGSIAGLGFMIDAIQKNDWVMAVSGLATMVLGLLAKDHDTH